jgi:hypothetical protein
VSCPCIIPTLFLCSGFFLHITTAAASIYHDHDDILAYFFLLA